MKSSRTGTGPFGRRVVRTGVAAAAALLALPLTALPASAALNDPPLLPHDVTVFPERDFVAFDGYEPDTRLFIRVVRDGHIIGSATGMTDKTGFLEVNHPGGVCWTGSTPDLVPGDWVEVSVDDSFDPEAADVDRVRTRHLSATAAFDDGKGNLVMHGIAHDGAGGQLPLEELEARIIAPDLVGLGLKRDVRALGAPDAPDEDRLTYDSDTSTHWTATFTGLSEEQREIALAGQSRIMSWTLDPLTGDRLGLTIHEVGEIGGPGFGGCPGPASWGVTGSAPVSVNATTVARDLVLNGVARDASAVTVSLDDEDPDTLPVTTAPVAPRPAAGDQTWSVTIPREQVAAFSDGTLTASATYTVGTRVVGERQKVDADGRPMVEPKLDASGAPVLQAKTDETGAPVLQEQLDANGAPVMREKVDADGMPVLTPKVEADGTPVLQQRVDAHGELVFRNVHDDEGNLVVRPVLDADGQPVLRQQTDENGNPVFDADGNPVMEPVMEPVTEPVMDPVLVPVMEPVMVPVIEPVLVPVMEPVTEPITIGGAERLILKDTVRPEPPTATPNPGHYANTQAIALEGEPEATIRYTMNGSAPTPTTGLVFSKQVTVSSDLTIKAVVVDAAGNPSPLAKTCEPGARCAGWFPYTIGGPPAPPTVPDLAADSDTGASPVDDLTNDTTPTFVGAAENGAFVTIFVDGVAKGSGIAVDGTYTITTTELRPGVHVISATALNPFGTSSSSVENGITIETTAPRATTDVGAGTYSTMQVVALTADDPDATIYYTTDGTFPTPDTASRYVAPVLVDESLTLTYVAVDAAGNSSDVTSVAYTVVLDELPPTVTAPAASVAATSLSATSTIPVKLDWRGTDASESGVVDFELQQSIDGGRTWTDVGLADATATTLTRSLASGSYRFRVRGTDGAGNVSAWMTGPVFAVTARQENAAGITYTATGWTTVRTSAAAGAALRQARVAGTRARLTFTGTSVAWVSTKAANRGKAEVWIDGTKVTRTPVDLFSRTTQSRRIVFTKAGLAPGRTHTIEIRVLGTRNAAATNTLVDVDAFVTAS